MIFIRCTRLSIDSHPPHECPGCLGSNIEVVTWSYTWHTYGFGGSRVTGVILGDKSDGKGVAENIGESKYSQYWFQIIR